MDFNRDDALNYFDAFGIANMSIGRNAYESVINKLFDEIDFLKSKKRTFEFTDICPDYKTVEQFEMFIDSREKDIKNMYESIHQAKLNIAKLEGDTQFNSYYRSIAKKFLGYK